MLGDIKTALWFFAGYIVLISALLIFAQKDNSINPAIYVEFQNIEMYCLQQSVNDSVSRQCSNVLELFEYCVDNDCSAEYYYQKLESFDFELPVYRIEKSS